MRAIKTGRHSIVLGALDEGRCRKLAESTAHLDYPGVIGPDITARWFSNRAREVGLLFREPEPQQIYAISNTPQYPGALGYARPATIGNATLLADWLLAFHPEAIPHDPVPAREELERAAGEDRFLFWIDRGRPVSMAGIVERVYAEGRKTTCLYADLRNPAANRCYAKIRFTPVCKSLHLHRHG
jgi:hypothetical protein